MVVYRHNTDIIAPVALLQNGAPAAMPGAAWYPGASLSRAALAPSSSRLRPYPGAVGILSPEQMSGPCAAPWGPAVCYHGKTFPD